MTNTSDYDILEQVEEFKAISEFMEDPALDEALAMVLNAISKPDVKFAEAAKIINKIQALATKFAFMATYYKTVGYDGQTEKEKRTQRYKKDMYYTARDALDKLADAVKYVVRVQQ